MWSCCLLCFDGGFSRIMLEPGFHLSFKVSKGRYCVGYTTLSSRADEGGSRDYWKEFNPCPHGAEVKRGIRCRTCSTRDVTRACLMCDGRECHADPAIRRICEGSVAYVYLASFGEGMIKAGVSQGSRIPKRWIEQGADVAKRVLVGNGREVRRFESRTQNELDVLRRVKAEEKIDVLRSERDLEESIRLLNIYEGKVHEHFPEAQHFHEEPRITYPYYRLNQLDKRPLELKIRGGGEVSGRVLGVKGPILLLEAMGLPRAINLRRLVGRRIDTDGVSRVKAQSDLDRFLSAT